MQIHKATIQEQRDGSVLIKDATIALSQEEYQQFQDKGNSFINCTDLGKVGENPEGGAVPPSPEVSGKE